MASKERPEAASRRESRRQDRQADSPPVTWTRLAQHRARQGPNRPRARGARRSAACWALPRRTHEQPPSAVAGLPTLQGHARRPGEARGAGGRHRAGARLHGRVHPRQHLDEAVLLRQVRLRDAQRLRPAHPRAHAPGRLAGRGCRARPGRHGRGPAHGRAGAEGLGCSRERALVRQPEAASGAGGCRAGGDPVERRRDLGPAQADCAPLAAARGGARGGPGHGCQPARREGGRA